jgi:hypothetical protein
MYAVNQAEAASPAIFANFLRVWCDVAMLKHYQFQMPTCKR